MKRMPSSTIQESNHTKTVPSSWGAACSQKVSENRDRHWSAQVKAEVSDTASENNRVSLPDEQVVEVATRHSLLMLAAEMMAFILSTPGTRQREMAPGGLEVLSEAGLALFLAVSGDDGWRTALGVTPPQLTSSRQKSKWLRPHKLAEGLQTEPS